MTGATPPHTRPGGTLALTLWHGPAEAARAMHPVSLQEIERLTTGYGAVLMRTADMPDRLGHSGVSWIGGVLRLLDDGTGARPLLRHVILNEQQASSSADFKHKYGSILLVGNVVPYC